MIPIRQGDGTGLSPNGFSQVRKGDGTILYNQNVIPDSGMSRWSMEPDVSDESVAGDGWGESDGAVNGVTYNSTGGPDGSGAYEFSGGGGVITTPFNPGGLSEFSVAILFEAGSVSDTQPIFWTDVSSGFDQYAGLYINSSGTVLWNNEDGNGDGSMQVGTPSAGYVWATVTFNSGSETGYLDESETATNSNSLSTMANIDTWGFGGQYSTSASLERPIADARIYNKELTSDEVSNLVTTGRISG